VKHSVIVMRVSKLACSALFAVLVACAAEPPRYGEVVTWKAGEPPPASDFPGPGTVWRLDESDLMRLSPAPLVPAPPPPQLPPPPRADDWPYYGSRFYSPYSDYAPYWNWGLGLGFGFYHRRGW
jgi:hypothetical protein